METTKNCIVKFTTVLKDFIKENDIQNFKKFIKILYIQYKLEILSLFQELLQELIYHYDEKNIIFIKLIIIPNTILNYIEYNTDNYIQFIDIENKEFNWKKKPSIISMVF